MRVLAALSLSAACLLSGCALETTATNTTLHATESAGLSGNIHGGQQAVAGSHIYLFAAGTTASAGKGITASTANASISLITDNTNSDSKGNYVLSDANGSFVLTNKYSCTPGQQVYALAYTGNSGSGSNNAYLEMMTVLGTCPAAGNFTQFGYIIINELTTVAAAYALSGFASDALHISDDEAVVGNTTATVAANGMKNAFLNAAQIVQPNTGLPYNYDYLNPTGGYSYQAMITTVGDILAACINTNGGTPCPTLLANAKNANGIAPSDTATAAINIAQNPGNNVATLIGTVTGTPPFQPMMSTNDISDFTFGIIYQRPCNSCAQQQKLAIDSVGNVYTSEWQGGVSGGGSVMEFSPQGLPKFDYRGITGNLSLSNPWGLAIDPATDNLWIADVSHQVLQVYNAAGTHVGNVAGYPVSSNTGVYPFFLAFGSDGNLWASDNVQTVTKIKTDGTILSGTGYTGPQQYIHGIAADASGNLWAGIYDGSADRVQKFTSSGAVTQYTSAVGAAAVFGVSVDGNGAPWISDYGGHFVHFNASGVDQGLAGTASDAVWITAVDGGNNTWGAARNGYIYGFTSAGTAITPSTGVRGYASYFGNPYDIAFDASGVMWVLNDDGKSLSQVFGIGAPVVVPMGLALTKNKLGQRP